MVSISVRPSSSEMRYALTKPNRLMRVTWLVGAVWPTPRRARCPKPSTARAA
jgi:hypothetical protein